MTYQYQHILCEVKNGVGSLTLNSPRTLNSLSAAMIVEYRDVLAKWQDDKSVSCMFIQGAGEKALCAGGDVRRMHDDLVAHKDPGKLNDECVHFFTQEYTLDYEVHKFTKPIIAWYDGIVMGGGIGATNGASHKVVTERTVLAMPEITIGLYPDVGATYFFNKMPHGFGIYLAMTANRINAADALYLKMGDHFLLSEQKQELVNALHKANWTDEIDKNKTLVTSIVSGLNTGPSHLHCKVQEHEKYLSKFEKVQSAYQFKDLLMAPPDKDDWLEAGINIFETGSPISAHIILEQLKRGANLSLEDVFRSELNLSLQCTLRPDFVEGVRALLVDKDKKPRWRPSALTKCSPALIESYFKPLWTVNAHPLKDLGSNKVYA